MNPKSSPYDWHRIGQKRNSDVAVTAKLCTLSCISVRDLLLCNLDTHAVNE